MRLNVDRWVSLIAWVIVCFSTAGIGAAASFGAETFYLQLTRPSWAPPASLFGPVWTCLYALMAIAAWLIWQSRETWPARPALALFIFQLVSNALWSWLFFAWRLGALAFLDILVLWGAIAATITLFWRVRRLAGALLVPYLLWVTFASALNYSIWQLNPSLLG